MSNLKISNARNAAQAASHGGGKRRRHLPKTWVQTLAVIRLAYKQRNDRRSVTALSEHHALE